MIEYCYYCENNESFNPNYPNRDHKEYVAIYTGNNIFWTYCMSCANKFIDDKLFIKCGINNCDELICRKSYFCRYHGPRYRSLNNF